jgi:hypothetical protein
LPSPYKPSHLSQYRFFQKSRYFLTRLFADRPANGFLFL